MDEYNSGDTSKVNASLYRTIKAELENIESVLGEPIIKSNEEENKPEEDTNVTNTTEKGFNPGGGGGGA